MRHLNLIWLIALTLTVLTAKAQRDVIPASNGCLPNIGFENGTLEYWDCSIGQILRDGSLNLSSTGPTADRHTVIQNTYPQALDPYGGFPINCPNGSGYSVRLGNSSAGGQAESMTYTFNIPADKNDFSILYNYAVVFQNPPHQPWEQPRFQSKIYNVTDNKYIDCGAFEFVASSGLPGFQLASGSGNVYYKPWAPVTVNLIGLAGKTVRLEFFTNDCAFTQHFGYAYIDVNEDCLASPISGNTVCGIPSSITLTAPFGFAAYSWYNINFTQMLGNDNTLTLTPVPPANTQYAVVITPYEGIGCLDTLYTSINISNEPFNLNVIPEITGCSTGVDLTSALVTAGSTPGLTYYYYTDPSQTNYVPVPSVVTASGTYYIKGVNRVGCNEIKPIKVTIMPPPALTVNSPAGVCIPQTIDLTAPAITMGSEPGLTYSYWKDKDGINRLLNPAAVDKSGTYYIMASKTGTCDILKPVDVKIGAVPDIRIHDPSGCGRVDITDTSVTSGSTPGLFYSYWSDAAATIPLNNVASITSSGTYYILSSSSLGCSVPKPINVTVNPFPVFTVADPPSVVYPVQTIDLTTAVSQSANLSFTYWLDSLTRKPVNNPRAITKRGRYFIRGTNEFGCSTIKGVNANILPPPSPIVYAPNAFTPNGDGLNDLFKIKIIGETSVHLLKIFNRWGQVVYDSPDMTKFWGGKLKNLDLPTGVYVWTLAGLDTYYKKPFMAKGLITLVR
jgi:gliding motility-associated-like protein